MVLRLLKKLAKKGKKRLGSAKKRKPKKRQVKRTKAKRKVKARTSPRKKTVAKRKRKPVAKKRPKAKKTTKRKVARRTVKAKKAKPKKASPKAKRLTAVSPEAGLQEVGKITHYFPHVNAGVMIASKPISTGDTLYIKGHTTDFKQNVTSMQVNHVPIQQAKRGDEIGLLVNKRVRHGDKVYKL